LNSKSLTDLRGIGEGLAKKLIENFGSEKEVIKALSNNDVEAISRIEGIGEKLATRLIRIFHDVSPEQFLKTPDSLNIYRQLIKKIQVHASTPYARAKAILLTPYSDKEKILNLQQYSRDYFVKAKALSVVESDLVRNLKSLSALKSGTDLIDTGDRIIYTDDMEVQEKLDGGETGQYCSIEFVESIETLLEKIQSGSGEQMIFLSKDELQGEEGGITILSTAEAGEEHKLVPEKELAFFAVNKKTILFLLDSLNLVMEIIPEDFNDLASINKIHDLGSLIGQITESGEIEENIDNELDRITTVLNEIDNVLLEEEVKLNESLTEFFTKSTIELEGKRLLELLKSGRDEDSQFDVREILDPSLYLHVEEELEKCEAELIRRFSLQDEEETFINGLFPRQIEFPISHSSEKLDQLISFLSAKAKTRAYKNKVRIAGKLGEWREFCILLNRRILELDYQLMIGKFMLKNGLTLPRIVDNAIGIRFNNGFNMDLLNEYKTDLSSLQKVRYEVGNIGERSEFVTLLSGANSGGKTTLLMLIAQISILSHMGLGVPSESCDISIFREFHYYKKSAGTYTAGAFETFLKSFAQVLSGENKIVLADEMESISEPGASALVISAFLDSLNSSQRTCGVFVSHLASQIKEHCITDIRIDGIEATGLDENLQLVVDRNPVYGKYARSTPQLIVERMTKLAKGKEQEVFNEILTRFKQLR